MAVSKEDILGAIADMSVMDLVELIEAMELLPLKSKPSLTLF